MTNQDSMTVSEKLSTPVDETPETAGTPATSEGSLVDEASTDEVEAEAKSRRLPKGKMEIGAMVIMAIGFLMIFQPYSLLLYNYSFIIIIIGTLSFIIVSHFPDEE